MPLHPMLQTMADNAGSGDRSARLSDGTPEAARQGYDMMKAIGGTGPDLASVEDRTIPGPAGDLPIRVYTPAGDGPFPVIAFYHGGGWTIGSLESHDPLCRQLAGLTPAIVVATAYRLAPEAPFPAAVDDAWAALRWIEANAVSLNGDPSRIAVAGDSAGGNLSAVTAIKARDEGGPALAFQLLLYPSVDARLGYPSHEENAEGFILSKDAMEWFFGHYVGDRDQADLDDWRLSPIVHKDLAGLPAALVITAECDPLRDEGEAYATRLVEFGVAAKTHRYEGMCHAFMQLAQLVPDGKAAIEESAAALRGAFAASGVRA